jgi:hypothetical protein
MKIKYLAVILLLAFGLIHCHKGADNYQSKGTMIGPDFRDCVCCGGWYIMIDTTEFEFESLPEDTNIDLQRDTFPINVKLDWQLSDKMPCPYKWVIITRIIKE